MAGSQARIWGDLVAEESFVYTYVERGDLPLLPDSRSRIGAVPKSNLLAMTERAARM